MLSPLSILQNTRALCKTMTKVITANGPNIMTLGQHHSEKGRTGEQKGETASAAMPFFSWHAKVQQIPTRRRSKTSVYLKGTEEATHNLRRNQIRLLSAGWLEGDDGSLNFQQFCFGSLLC